MSEVTRIARDGAYIAVGVIAVQKAQVRRRELRSQLESQLGEAKAGFDQVSGTIEEQLKMVEERLGDIQGQVGSALGTVETRVEQVLGTVQSRLPEPAADLLGSAREAAREARGQLRTLVRQGRATAAA